ncbi:alpha-pore-forming cytotoxin subunit MakB [Pseudomonas fluorescens]|uniref:alpha-pore-forming cytotoxin subunit MakB n=1 Tax=Pseudomonas TaxID=286 RepID=UPI003D0384FB
MLSPTVNFAKTLLVAALNEVVSIDNYCATTRTIFIGKLTEDPDWLASVRNRVAMLAAAGGGWIMAKPSIWAPILDQFATYNATFASIASLQKNGQLVTASQWVQVLGQVLIPQLQAAAVATDAAGVALKEQLDTFSDIQPLLEASIDQGWESLAAEEQQMVKIAAELARLEDLVGSLGDAITSGSISDGKGVVSTSVSIVYDVAVDGAEGVPFLSFLTSAITIGRFFADLVEGSAEVQATLQKIAELQIEASQAAQAAAATKSVLQLLYNLQLSFRSINDVVPQLSQMWRDQAQGVQQAIDALNDGADPAGYFDLLTLSTAAANWQTIAGFAASLTTFKTATGRPVVLNPQQARTRSVSAVH